MSSCRPSMGHRSLLARGRRRRPGKTIPSEAVPACRVLGLKAARALTGSSSRDPLRLAGLVAERLRLPPRSICLLVGGLSVPAVVLLDAGAHWLLVEADPVELAPAIPRYRALYTTAFIGRFLVERAAISGVSDVEAARLALERARHAAAGFAVSRRQLTREEIDLAIRTRSAAPIRCWLREKTARQRPAPTASSR